MGDTQGDCRSLHAGPGRDGFIGVGQRHRQAAEIGDHLSIRRATCTTADQSDFLDRSLRTQRIKGVEQTADDPLDRGTGDLLAKLTQVQECS